ncbi:MAG: calcium/sodium antiporter [Clostridia bacterium]|nr:calcium/sodium antiporter [Clostridia bacterium]
MTLVFQLLLLAVGFVLLVKGADWFVEGASGIADKFGIPQLVIGLTIVAMGTSAPETAVSITAALKGNADVSVGNVVGSNILNVLIILGISAVITSIAVAKTTIRYEIPIMLGATFLLLGLGMTGNSITLWEGIVFLGCFALYLLYMFVMVKKGQMQAEKIESASVPLWRLLLMMVVGLGLVVWGSDITIDAATKIAQIAKLSDKFIGLTVVALGTSLPELVTSVVAAKKGKADIAIGNIVGSNIFNILFVLGISALIVPVTFDYGFIKDCLIAAGAGILLWICVFPKKKLTRWGGAAMLLCYAAYFAYLLMH